MSHSENSGDPLRTQLLQRLQSLHRAGVTAIPHPVAPPIPSQAEAAGVSAGHRDTEPVAAVQTAAASKQQEAPSDDADATSIPSSAGQVTDPAESLRVLNDEVCQCTLCPELVKNRTQTVFGVGNPRPRLCFFGEGPGADEDRQGEPFVGAAGQLLDKIIAAMGLQREDVYILNVVKCRPPGNRTPTEEEANHCRPFFTRQLEILQPEFICCLGACAAKTLLQTTQSVGRLRGQFHAYEKSRVVVTYHPAYLLRRPEEKGKTWSDMKMIMHEMGLG